MQEVSTLTDPDIKAAYLYKLSIETLAAKKGIVSWLSPEEAAIILGIPINGKVNNKLAWLVQYGHIKRHARSGKETQYWWDGLEEVAQLISQGEIVIPTSF